jgi:protein TonB
MNSAATALPPLPVDFLDESIPPAPHAQRGTGAPPASARARGARRESMLAAALAMAAHAAGLALLATQTTAAIRPPELSSIQIALIAAEPSPQPPSPQPAPQPAPAPAEQPRVVPPAAVKPVAPPTPRPRPVTPKPIPTKRTVAPTALTEPAAAPEPQPAADATPPQSAPMTAAAAPAAASAPFTAARYDAAYLNNPAPAYPMRSRRLREEGQVMLRVLVSPGGLPARIELRASSGFDSLDRAAQDAVARWRFVPARQGDNPVEAWVQVPIVFKLQGS